MTPKRKGKEIETSGSGASRKQATVHNHGIEFKDQEQRNRYKSCYTLILDLKILIQIPLLFPNTFKLTVFPTVLQLRTLLFLSFNFCVKSYKRAFWSFPTKEPIFVPTICP